MRHRVVPSLAFCLLLVVTARGQSPAALTVLRAAPEGEVAELAQVNEIRIVFSEPMVTLGRIPQPVVAPFVRIDPSVRGTFRWSGTTILIFTPDRDQSLAYATSYSVTVDRAARAVSGRQLLTPFTFHFTTPTTKLLTLQIYRVQKRFDRPAQLYLRFNQPVTPAEILSHVRVRYAPQTWEAPTLTPAAEAQLAKIDPAGLRQFRAKVAAVATATRSNAAVPVRLATRFDAYPASPDLVVLETTVVPPPETHLQVTIDRTVPSPQGPETPSSEQTRTTEMAPAFFARGFQCVAACDPSGFNPLELTADVALKEVQAATSVTSLGPQDVAVRQTNPTARRDEFDASNRHFILEDLRYPTQPPVSTYAVRLAPTLEATDGQRLGYPWLGVVENWHESAFTSFGDGHGVWESSGGRQLPFFARNVQNIRQWVAGVSADGLMSRLHELQQNYFRAVPPGDGRARRLSVNPDRIQSHGLDVSSALNARGTGLVWAGVEDGAAIPRSRQARGMSIDVSERRKSTIVQVTNLGITVKDSPQNTLIFVTRLDNGEPVADARVSIVRTDNSVFWRGTTNTDGGAIAPDTPLRPPNRPYEFSFIVIAEKDDDVAYVANDWNEGIAPWAFGLDTDLDEAEALLRGTVFTDRGVYRLGEEVHFKAILRRDTGRGIQLLPTGTTARVALTDSRNREIDSRTVRVNDWSSAEWTFTLPSTGALGD